MREETWLQDLHLARKKVRSKFWMDLSCEVAFMLAEAEGNQMLPAVQPNFGTSFS
jgi:hypothetical protein